VTAKLDADAERVVARAREEARKRRQGEVAPEHILTALFASVPAWNEMRRLAIDVKELRERVASSLSGTGEVGAYRDVAYEPRISADVERLVARAAPKGRLTMFARIDDVALLRAAFEEPNIARLLLDLRTWDDSSQAVMTRAQALATTRGHVHVALEHVLRILLRDAFFDHALTRLAADTERLRTRLDEELDREGGPTKASVEAVASAYETAKRGEPQLVEIQPSRAFAIRVLEELEASPMLARSGVDAVELAHYLAHGGPPLDVANAVPAHALVEVIVHNDEGLTEALLDRVLHEVFELTEHRELYFSGLTDRGHVVVGRWPAKEARERRARALLLARRSATPLRITLRRPTR
jgi:ATP-dependent Clp protease ATP-binding subunit ClpA